MTIYWLMFFTVFLFALIENPNYLQHQWNGFSSIKVSTLFFVIFLTLIIGYRSEIGADWGAYLHYVNRMEHTSFMVAMSYKDPGYQFLNYVSYHLGFGIFGVNLFSGLIFSLGLLIFCSKQPRPFLSLLCSIPYLVIVVAMGYTRQGVAIGIVMLALTKKDIRSFCILVAFAALFHKSAVLLIPLAIALSTKNKFLIYFVISIAAVLAYFVLIQDSVDDLLYVYVEKEYQSSGAFIRVFMCAVPAILFLYFREKFTMEKQEKKLWSIFSLLSILCFCFLFLFSSTTTIIDRVALYLLPLQLVVFSYLPQVLEDNKTTKYLYIYAISFYYFLVQFVWLFFANNAAAWLPYKFHPFTLL